MDSKLVKWGLVAFLGTMFCVTVFLGGMYAGKSRFSQKPEAPEIWVTYDQGIMTLASDHKIAIHFESGMLPGNEADYLTKLELDLGIGSHELFQARQNLDMNRITLVKVPPTRLMVLKGMQPSYTHRRLSRK